jgi:hypothetical protein
MSASQVFTVKSFESLCVVFRLPGAWTTADDRAIAAAIDDRLANPLAPLVGIRGAQEHVITLLLEAAREPQFDVQLREKINGR